jgi:hypothetical protein
MPWRRMGEWRYGSTIRRLVTSWKWIVNFTLLPLCPWGMSFQYPLDWRLVGTQGTYGRCGVGKTCPSWKCNPGRSDSSPLLSWLSYPDSHISSILVRSERKLPKSKHTICSTSLSACLHVEALEPLNGFSWNLISESFTEICRSEWSLINIWQE